LANQLKGNAGIIICATHYLEARIKSGVTRGSKGFAEIESRIGGKCIRLPKPSLNDLKETIRVNGISDEMTVNKIANEVETDYKGSKWRLKRLVMAAKRKEAQVA
jgi:hypothetical protein